MSDRTMHPVEQAADTRYKDLARASEEARMAVAEGPLARKIAELAQERAREETRVGTWSPTTTLQLPTTVGHAQEEINRVSSLPPIPSQPRDVTGQAPSSSPVEPQLAPSGPLAGSRQQPTSAPTQSSPPPAQYTEFIPDLSEESVDKDKYLESVTRLVALQQELDTTRRALQEKDRVIEATDAQCRRLEDELEDHRVAYDDVKQDLERKKLLLTATREKAEQVVGERDELEERYWSLMTSEVAGETPPQDPEIVPQPVATPAIPAPNVPVLTVIVGVVVGILLAVITIGIWWKIDLTPDGDAGSADARRSTPASPQLSTETRNRPPIPSSTTPEANAELPAAKAATEEPKTVTINQKATIPMVLGTVRDRLEDGSTGPLMLVLQGGAFTMGKRQILPTEDEGPAHQVHVGDFLIGATEVTFEEYDRFARATGRRFPHDHGWGRGLRPVVDVSWGDARAYAQWLSHRTGKRYRLPSEAEWEYAAGAGQRSPYWWGYKPGQGKAVCFDCGTPWDNRSSIPVGSFDPNPLGLYDTAGNVMEWIEDCYHPNYQGAPANGLAWGDAGCGLRVARGGAFNKPARSMHTTSRHRFAPETRINALGFRLARDE